MGILEGIEVAFTPILSALYNDAKLVRMSINSTDTGSVELLKKVTIPIKLQPDRITKAQRDNAGDSYTSKDARFLVLQIDRNGNKINPPISSDDRITYKNESWALADITQDPAQVYFDMRATPIGSTDR